MTETAENKNGACTYFRQSYAFQQSEKMVVPGLMNFFIMRIKVSAFLSGTGTAKHSLVSRQTPPKTHTPSRLRPRLYFTERGKKY